MLSDNIRKYRKLNHMSQDELAEKLQVTRQSISLWETGQTQPSLDNIVALAKLFDISTDNLLAVDEPESVSVGADYLPDRKPPKKNMLILIIIICFVLVAALVTALLLWKNGVFGIKNGDITSSSTAQLSSILNTKSTYSSLMGNGSGNNNNKSSSNSTQSSNKNNSSKPYSQNSSSKTNSGSSSKNSVANNNGLECISIF